jgi:hypothetical protein
MQAKNDPEFGVTYTYEAVANLYSNDNALDSVALVNGSRVVALRLREDYNPQIFATPAQLWVDEKPAAACECGKALAGEAARIPVFVKRNGKQNYTFVGDHAVLTRESTPAELATARAEVPHAQGVSRIVFLKRV